MDLITTLPDDILDNIFCFLDAKCLIRCSVICQRFYAFSGQEHYWKSLCNDHWDITNLPENVTTWKECYVWMYGQYGRYVNCYKRVKRCYQRILDVTHEKAPSIYNSLSNGMSEDRVQLLQENLLGQRGELPLEYRCFYRLCNGQRRPPGNDLEPYNGLFGGYDDTDSGDFLCCWAGGDTQISPHINPAISYDCCLSFVPICRRINAQDGGIMLCIRDSSSSPARASCRREEDHQKLDGLVVSRGPHLPDGRRGFFIYAHSFMEFLENFANKLPAYPVVNDCFLKFDFNSEGDTGPFHVTTRTSFFRERSFISESPDQSEFHYFYRITMKMHPEALKSDSCQLETRHWVITDAHGHVEHVDGPGVVGNYPVMRPGAEFTWISRTSYTTTVGYMEGHFSMRKLNSGAETTIMCPKYKMVAPEILIG